MQLRREAQSLTIGKLSLQYDTNDGPEPAVQAESRPPRQSSQLQKSADSADVPPTPDALPVPHSHFLPGIISDVAVRQLPNQHASPGRRHSADSRLHGSTKLPESIHAQARGLTPPNFPSTTRQYSVPTASRFFLHPALRNRVEPFSLLTVRSRSCSTPVKLLAGQSHKFRYLCARSPRGEHNLRRGCPKI